MEKISLIWTNWSQNEFRSGIMRKSINSLIATTKVLLTEIIAVDNGGNIEDSKYLLHLTEENAIQFYIRNSVNLYFGFARNQGVDIACGEYIGFSDNDIEYKNGWLEKSITLLKEFPDRKIAITPLKADRQHRNEAHWTEWFEFNGERFPANMRAGSNSWLMRRKDFDEVGRFRNHRVAGSKWTDQFVKKGFTMITMEESPLALDMGFKKVYDIDKEVEIKRVFSNGDKIIIND